MNCQKLSYTNQSLNSYTESLYCLKLQSSEHLLLTYTVNFSGLTIKMSNRQKDIASPIPSLCELISELIYVKAPLSFITCYP